MFRRVRPLLLSTAFVSLVASSAFAQQAPACGGDLSAFLAGVKSEAVAKGIPADVLTTLGKAMSTAALSPPVRKFIDEIGTQAVGNLPAKAQANFEAYYPMVKQMTEDTGAKLD